MWHRQRIRAAVDTHSRGRAVEIDPADQWILDSHTDDYELRPFHCAAESARAAEGIRTGRRPHGRAREVTTRHRAIARV